MDIPCEICITKAVCRHKTYGQLTKDCKIITGYKIRDIAIVLKPSIWRYNPNSLSMTPHSNGVEHFYDVKSV